MSTHDDNSLAGEGDWDSRITFAQRDSLSQSIRIDSKRLAILANGIGFSGKMSFGNPDDLLFVITISIQPTNRARGQHAKFDEQLGSPRQRMLAAEAKSLEGDAATDGEVI